jgi:hypothetical protein
MATLKKSTGKKSKDPMSSVGATPVNLLVRLANGEEKKIRDTCGLGLEKPLANYDPDTQSWKMFGDISLWGDSRLLLNLPPSGMTRSGVLFLQPAWEPITGETESLLWPTPTTQETEHPDAVLTDTGRRLSKDGKSSHSLGLADAARLWPTPTVDDASNVNPKPNRFRGLVAAVNETWPTPTTVDTFTPKSRGNPTLGDAARTADSSTGKLNPTWVEWLMGFPLGWTDLED